MQYDLYKKDKIKYYIEINGLSSTFPWEITECTGHYTIFNNFIIDKEKIIGEFKTEQEAKVYLKLWDL